MEKYGQYRDKGTCRLSLDRVVHVLTRGTCRLGHSAFLPYIAAGDECAVVAMERGMSTNISRLLDLY